MAVARREAHNRYWCSPRVPPCTLSADDTEVPPVLGEHFHNIVEVELVGMPLRLRFEQQSIFGPVGTGGALWQSELLLAEWCINELAGEAKRCLHQDRCTSQPLGVGVRPRVLELACGVAPVAGLACIGLGCDVLMTDLARVLRFTEANLRLNHDAVVAARHLAVPGSCGAIGVEAAEWAAGVEVETEMKPALPPCQEPLALSRTACDTAVFEFGSTLPPRLAAFAPLDVVMCSDCLWNSELHEPLACALAALLGSRGAGVCASGGVKGGSTDGATQHVATEAEAVVGTMGASLRRPPRCVVAFQKRSHEEDLFFKEVCPRHGLHGEPAHVEELLSTMRWDKAVSEGFQRNESLASYFFITEVVLA